MDDTDEFNIHRLAGKNGEKGCRWGCNRQDSLALSRASASDWSRLKGGGLVCRCCLRYNVVVSHVIARFDCAAMVCVCSSTSQLLVRVVLQKSDGYVGLLCKYAMSLELRLMTVTLGKKVCGCCICWRKCDRKVTMESKPHAAALGPDGCPRLGPWHSASASPLERYSIHP